MLGPNLLIGNGEVLTSRVLREPGGGGNMQFPYTIDKARERLGPAIIQTLAAIQSLPNVAKPHDEATSVVTVHPAFQAKTQMPADVFRRAGLRTVGSKLAKIIPDNDIRKLATKQDKQPTIDIYISGTLVAFQSFLDMLMSTTSGIGVQQEFCKLEAFRFLVPQERLLGLEGNDIDIPIEIVLHGDGFDVEMLDSFEKYSNLCGAKVYRAKHLTVPGLVFMPGLVSRSKLDEFAQFTALRAVRRLPVLRLNRPIIRQNLAVPVPALPTDNAIDSSLHVAIFDGGLGTKDFAQWATEYIPAELSNTHADYLSHGTEVTSALLFGAIPTGTTELPRPFFNVIHYRVIGQADESDPDLYECMKRIDAVLHAGNIDFANLSLGPRLAIDDGQPHAWTSMLDNRLASGDILMTVAVGNDGEIKGPMGRIQPPADAVNVLSVGAADSPDFLWNRASYSCFGPGRSPGIVKPDGLAFGGTELQPLVLMNPLYGGLTGVQGTSFSSPLVLRTAAAARAMSGTPLTATALRALLIHRAERSAGHDTVDVGWGRFPDSPEDLLTCAESEASVLYQGHISAGETMRIHLPIPAVPYGISFHITATFCFASPVDPANPVNYTKHGLTIVFRPKGAGSTAAFFSTSSYESEQELRRDAYKWETVLHRACKFSADELLDPCFDVDHGARQSGLSVINSKVPPLPYVLVATIATAKGEPIYQSILQKYRTLTPIQLRQRVQLHRS